MLRPWQGSQLDAISQAVNCQLAGVEVSANLSSLAPLEDQEGGNPGNPVLDAAGGPVSGYRKPQPQSWMAYKIGRGNFNLGAVVVRPKKQVRSELYISGNHAKAFFGLLKRQKDQIERELGYPLEWEELPDGRDSRISYLNDVAPEEKVDWPRQHQWLAKRLNDMHRVLVERVRVLDADEWRPG